MEKEKILTLIDACKKYKQSELYFNGFGLKKLPPEIYDLKHLKELHLRNNNLSKLQNELSNLKNLEYLDLSLNSIAKFPSVILNLKNLKNLDLSVNPLRTIPSTLFKLPNLQILNIERCNLLSPPPEVIHKGLYATKEYYRQVETEGKENLYEAKLLILGEAGAGKTTLAKKIQNPNYNLDHDEKSTEGIDVVEWRFNIDAEKNFKLNIWDFGGQEIYHSTHQFFLTKRSLYIIVADTRREDSDFYYWLNIVKLLSERSPVIIVKK